MKLVVKPKSEAKIVAPTKKEATVQSVYASMVSKGESCVDHLCGCK